MKGISDGSLIKQPQLLVVIGIALLASFFLLKLSFLTLMGLLGLFSLILLFILPHAMIIFLLVSRSSLDVISDIQLYTGQLKINAPSVIGIFVIAIGFLYLITQKSIRKIMSDKVSRHFLFWLASLLFSVYIAWSTFGSKGGLLAIRDWVRISSFFVIYCLMFTLVNNFDYRKIVNYLFIAIVVPLGFAYYQIFSRTGFAIANVNRIYGTFGHPNVFGSFLVLFITLTLCKIRDGKNMLLWIGILLLELVALINVYAMGVMIMLLVAASVFVLLNTRKRFQRMLIFGIIGLALVSFIFSSSGQKRLSEVKRAINIRGSLQGREASNSMEWRIKRWSLLIQKWPAKPLVGYGLNTSSSLVLPNEWPNEPHNDAVRFLVETGIIGLIIYLKLIFMVGIRLWKSYYYFKKKEPQLASLTAALLGIFSAWMVASSIGNPISETVFQYYFWALFGISWASYNKLKISET